MFNSGDEKPLPPPPHILVFPFYAPGHIIPLLDLTHLLITRGLTVTVLVTPDNLVLLQPLLSSHPSSSIQPLVLSPPNPPIPSHLNFASNLRATAQLYDPILQWFNSHTSPPVAIIADFFLGWTQHLASQIGIPRLAFWSSGALVSLIGTTVWRDPPKYNPPNNDDNFLISFPNIPNSPNFPLWQMSLLWRPFQQGHPDWEFAQNCISLNSESWGVVFNSFTELEKIYLDHVKKEMGHDRVAVGPLCLSVDSTSRGRPSTVPHHELMAWLDGRADHSVVYVCFGSRMALSENQTVALTAALECSGLHYVWCTKAKDVAEEENRVVGKGFIIKGWAPQVTILSHRAVGVFVTHCGWNSVLEVLATGVMMLTWPICADQFYNAKLLVDELKVAARACEGGDLNVPDSNELAHLLNESMGGTRPEKVRVMQLCDAALEAVKGGGSSGKDLDMFVEQLVELNSKRCSINK